MLKGEIMGLMLEWNGTFNPIKLLGTTKESEGVIHSFYGSDCCKSEIVKEFKCSKCQKPCLSIKVDVEEKQETGSSDLWSLVSIPLNDVELVEISNWYWIIQGELKKPAIKGRDIEKLNQYKQQLQNKGDLKELFMELVNNKKALKGKIILRRGKINTCYILPYCRNGYRNLVLGLIDGNKCLVVPETKFEVPIKVKAEL